MAENWLETRCRNSGETQTSLSFRFPEAKQTKETGLEAGTAQGRHGGPGQARPLGGTSPAAATREAGSSGARGRGTQIPRLGALGAAIARVQAPGDPPPSALRASPARDAWEQGTGRPTHPPRPPSAAPPGPKRPTFPEPGAAPRGELQPRELGGTVGCRPRGGCCLIPSGCRSANGLVPSKRKRKLCSNGDFL